MPTSNHELSENAKADVRESVSAINHEFASLSKGATVEEYQNLTQVLRASWGKLVDLLGFGPAPEVRACPNCQRFVMREASRCGYCWTPLLPFDSSKDVLGTASTKE